MRKRMRKNRVEYQVEERKQFGYMISEVISREQRGKFRSMLELLGEKRGA